MIGVVVEKDTRVNIVKNVQVGTVEESVGTVVNALRLARDITGSEI